MACVAWHTRIPHAYVPHMMGDIQTRHCDAASELSPIKCGLSDMSEPYLLAFSITDFDNFSLSDVEEELPPLTKP
eukprot:scaffold40115_cov58-Attheya_sp.AAC.7